MKQTIDPFSAPVFTRQRAWLGFVSYIVVALIIMMVIK